MPAKKSASVHKLPLRIVVVDPPPRVRYALQLGRDQHVAPTSSSPSRVTFEFTVDVEEDSSTGSFRLKGAAVQGPKGQRFVYLPVWWHRPDTDELTGGRVKVTLESITPEQLRKAASDSASVLEAEFEGAGKNGLPMCASVKLIGGGWHLR